MLCLPKTGNEQYDHKVVHESAVEMAGHFTLGQGVMWNLKHRHAPGKCEADA